MRSLLFLVIIVINNSLFSQTGKLNIALVSQMDTTFTVFSGRQTRDLDLKLKDHWLEGMIKCLDTSVVNIAWEKLPDELYIIKDYTNGFKKADKRMHPWLRSLSIAGYDIVIFIGKANLWGANKYGKINWHSYGMDIKQDWAFSLNRVLLYEPATAKIIKEPRQDSYTYEYVASAEGPGKGTPLNDVVPMDVFNAIWQIERMDMKTIKMVCAAVKQEVKKKKALGKL